MNHLIKIVAVCKFSFFLSLVLMELKKLIFALNLKQVELYGLQ